MSWAWLDPALPVPALTRASHLLRTKLSLSHALAQSVKLSFFEAAVGTTIDQTKGIPQDIIESGKIQVRTLCSSLSEISPNTYP